MIGGRHSSQLENERTFPFSSYRIAPSLLLSRPISANSYSATNLYVYKHDLRMLPHQKFFFFCC